VGRTAQKSAEAVVVKMAAERWQERRAEEPKEIRSNWNVGGARGVPKARKTHPWCEPGKGTGCPCSLPRMAASPDLTMKGAQENGTYRNDGKGP